MSIINKWQIKIRWNENNAIWSVGLLELLFYCIYFNMRLCGDMYWFTHLPKRQKLRDLNVRLGLCKNVQKIIQLL